LGQNVDCLCADIDELEGNSAINYAQGHLNELRVDGRLWQIEYMCPETAVRWLLDYPHSEYHGGGHPHLRKISNSYEK
jgi:hypothetical protein